MRSIDVLRDLGVHNPYNAVVFAKRRGVTPDVYIDYRPQDHLIGARWQVISPSHKTDPDGHWMNHGAKSFHVWNRRDRAAILEDAKAWAAEHYGVTEWAKITGLAPALFPKPVADVVTAAVREAAKRVQR
jgi:hypothetical protein